MFFAKVYKLCSLELGYVAELWFFLILQLDGVDSCVEAGTENGGLVTDSQGGQRSRAIQKQSVQAISSVLVPKLHHAVMR